MIALGESGADPVIRRNAVINAQQLMLDESVALFLGYPKINIVGNKHIDGIKTVSYTHLDVYKRQC